MTTKHPILFAVCCSLAALILPSAQAQPDPLKTSEVVIFRNGYTYVRKTGEVIAPNGIYSISQKDFPSAYNGTFWANANSGIQWMRTQVDTITKTYDVNDLVGLLKANEGKEASISVMIGSTVKELKGTIQKVLEQKNNNQYYGYSASLLAFKTATGVQYLNTGNIQQVEFTGESNYTFSRKVAERTFSIKFGNNKEKQSLDLVYMQSGFSWKPLYKFEFSDDESATITMNAEIINYNLDIQNADLKLVVGNGVYGIDNSIDWLFGSGESSAPIGMYKNIQKWNYEDASLAEGADAAPIYINDDKSTYNTIMPEITTTGGENEDFYIYTIKNMNLGKGSVASAQLAQGKVNLNTRYVTQIGSSYFGDYYFYNNLQFGDQKGLKADRQATFKNTLGVPFSAGTLYIEKNEKDKKTPFGLNNMPYLASNQETTISLGFATQIFTDHTEKMASKADNATTFNGLNYALVTIESTFTVTNSSSKSLQYRAQRSVGGKPVNSSSAWELKEYPVNNNGLNGSFNATWDLNLKAGESKTITYSYQFFVRM